MSKMLVAVLALAAVAAVTAQIQICDNNIKPGQVLSSTIKLSSSTYENNYSSLAVSWPRPNDRRSSNGLDSCITEYEVAVFRASDGQRLQSALVSVSPPHTSASYTAKGLSPGQRYQVAVTGKGPGGQAASGEKSQAFTTATAPPAPSCRQPQSVSNIRKTGGSVAQGSSKASMTIGWDPSSTPRECISEYVINIYPAGSQNMIKTTTVPATSTSFNDNIYTPGQNYEFYIYARNPSIGASGNGIGLRSPTIQAPLGTSGITPL